MCQRLCPPRSPHGKNSPTSLSFRPCAVPIGVSRYIEADRETALWTPSSTQPSRNHLAVRTADRAGSPLGFARRGRFEALAAFVPPDTTQCPWQLDLKDRPRAAKPLSHRVYRESSACGLERPRLERQAALKGFRPCHTNASYRRAIAVESKLPFHEGALATPTALWSAHARQRG